ncbi:MAG: hypothetical protein ACTSPW_03435, partial [Promethearchaeota archaeon]
MINNNKTKVYLFILLMSISFFNNLIFLTNSNDFLTKSGINKNYFKEKPKNSDYTSSLTNSGVNINISLHESLLNSTIIQFDNLTKKNYFIQRSPIIKGFNSSYVNISLINIIAKNHSLVVEDDNVNSLHDFDNANPDVASFQIIGNAYLENISVYVRNAGGANATVMAVLYKSIWNAGSSRSEPSGNNVGYIKNLGTFNVPNNTFGIYSITNIHYFLNNSNTENNTWFIGLFDGGSGADTRWYYVDDGSNGDNDDESYCYYYSTGWHLVENIFGTDYVDFRLTVGLSPINNTPKPSDINLKINGTAVNDNGTDNSGYWVSNEAYWSSSGNLKFILSADWYDVKLNVSKVQINYTKTDLIANSFFKVFYNSSKVLWNITRVEGLNFFESKFTNYKINFTIPGIWYDIKAFNNSVEKTVDTSAPIINGYRDVIIKNAGNGTWYILANSTNLLSKIEIFQKGYKTPITTASISNIVEFNITFKEKLYQNNGLINLSVYSPKTFNDRLNFSREISNFPTGFEYNLGEWDIS